MAHSGLLSPPKEDVLKGIQNLLANCMNLQAGEHLLIVEEDDRFDYFDNKIGRLIADEADAYGAIVHRLMAPRIDGPDKAPVIVRDAMSAADHTLFLARIGDQMRFYPLPGSGSKIMCYALDPYMLAADACALPYGLMVDVLEEIQSSVDVMSEWRVTCPLGTDICGTSDPEQYAGKAKLDFSLKIFPVGPFRPLTCSVASGKLVTRFLPASATHLYEPLGLVLDDPVTLTVQDGRIVDFQGPEGSAKAAREHYEHVGRTLGIDPFVVHSWHSGTNPKISYPSPALDNIERWNGVVHSHPRYTHFHTCGNYGPGEISVSIIDASITFDGHEFWRDGTLVALEQERFQSIARRHGCTSSALEMNPDFGLN